MTSWNLRRVHRSSVVGKSYYGIYNAYYDSAGNLNKLVPLTTMEFESSGDLQHQLNMIKLATKQPVVDYYSLQEIAV